MPATSATTSSYPPLNLQVRTPRLTLAGATDELLMRLVPVVRAGIADTQPLPFDDPMSLYEDNPEREWRWLRGIWAGRARVEPAFWRLYFVVLVDGEPVGMQDLIGVDFARFGTVSTFSWLAPGTRGSGIGREMRAAVLQLAFAGRARGGRKPCVHRQPRVQPGVAGARLRAQRHRLGHPPRRGRTDPAVEADQGRLGKGPARRHRAGRRCRVPAGCRHPSSG